MGPRIVRFPPLLLVAIALLSACGGEDEVTAPPQPTATTLLVVSGNAQTGTVDQSLPTALVVQVNDQSGNPMAGIGVTFAVAAGGGSVATASTTTGQDGQASTTWTLGKTAGGNHRVTAAATGVGSSVAFAATADPDVGRVISAVSGDGQNAFRGTKVPLPIVVLVRDQFANPVTGHLVAFVALANSGTLDSAVAFTDVNGEARTGWTLSSTVGVNTAEAQSPGLTGDPVTFTATAHNLSITSVSPTPLLEGQAATIIGTGFDAIPTQNVVTVDGLSATVMAATATQLDITIPTACIPVGTLDVKVTVGGLTSAPFSKPFTPANILAMAAGEQVIVQDPTAFCFQFAATPNTETYLIGVQSVTELALSRTAVTLTSVAASGAAPAPPVAALGRPVADRRVAVDPEVARRAALMSRYRAMESRLLQRELETVRPMARPLLMAQAPGVVPPDVKVGDVININVPGVTTFDCEDFTPITTVVRTVGTHAVWLEDQGNPTGGYSPADIDAFSTQFDNIIYDTDVAYFGTDTDLDTNTRVVVVLTQEVNKLSLAGQVFFRDFSDPAMCAASNGGEFFYVWVPDPNGTVGDSISLDIVREFDPPVFAHEFAHVIQIGRRIQAGNPTMTLWEIEGQATLAEEVVGHAVEGHAVGQNLGGSVAYDLPGNDAASRFWYSGAFLDMGVYYGADLSVPRKVTGAPHDCTWLDRANKGVCVRAVEHGVTWSLLRWLSDHYGSGFPGGEQGFHRAIIDNTLTGFANLEDLVGVPIETLLAQWAAMLYVDNRVLVDGTVVVAADPKLTMPSWNLFDVFERIVFIIDGMDVQVHLLEPVVRGFQDFTASFDVRAASTAYFLVSGTGRPATAIRARGVSDGVLSSVMQYWVVRLQ